MVCHKVRPEFVAGSDFEVFIRRQVSQFGLP